MDVLQQARTLNYHITGIAADEVSARSLRAGGDIYLLCDQVNMDHIQMLG
jgi:hypothetical protein